MRTDEGRLEAAADDQVQIDRIQFGDLPRFVDFRYAARVARVNGAALAALASAPASPRGAQLVATTLTNNTTLVWKANKEPDLAGYDVVWRKTTAPGWQHSMGVGNVYRVTLKLSKDDYFFGVRAVDRVGNLNPPPQRSDSEVAIATPESDLWVGVQVAVDEQEGK